MSEQEQQVDPGSQATIDPFDAPIPGASLTSDPDNRAPYERPPQFTDPQAAIEEIFFRLTEDEENLDRTLDLMRKEVPVEDIAQVYLFKGFTDGMWTPDLILNLVEPTIYVLLNLAEYAGIEATIYPEDDMEEEDAFDTDNQRASALTARMAREMKGSIEEETMLPPQPAVAPRSLRDRLKKTMEDKES